MNEYLNKVVNYEDIILIHKFIRFELEWGEMENKIVTRNLRK
jgi:hypothetical protein